MGLPPSGRLTGGQGDWQREQRDEDDAEMEHEGAAPAQAGGCEVNIEIAPEQRRLKEQETRVPGGRRSAEARQDHPRQHRLDHEEQRS